MRLLPPSNQAPRKAFSLIELLVVISIIALLTGISFPVVRTLLRNTAVNTAESQVNNALTAARVFATRSNSFVSARSIGGTLRTSKDSGDGFSGAIVLFATDNTLRICENDENALDRTNSPNWLEFFNPGRNGYTPVPDLEDLRISGRVIPLGIVRTGSTPFDIQLVPPPFAMRVSNDGTIDQGQAKPMPVFTGERVVYISATGEVESVPLGNQEIQTTLYDIDNDRASLAGMTYDATAFGLGGNELMPDGRTQQPFGVIETVSGVLLVDTSQFPSTFDHPDGSGPVAAIPPVGGDTGNAAIYDEDQSAAILNWAAENGTFARIMLFNRYTGQDLTR